MAKICFVSSENDEDFTVPLAACLQQAGHVLTIREDSSSYVPGPHWEDEMNFLLKENNVFILVISRQLTLIGKSRANIAHSYAVERPHKMLFLPVVIENVDWQQWLKEVSPLIQFDKNVSYAASALLTKISEYIGQRVAQDQRNEEVTKREAEVAQRIEEGVEEWVKPAMESLLQREERNRKSGNGWYTLGFLALVLGALITLFGIAYRYNSFKPETVGLGEFGIIALKFIVTVGLLGACAKYAFTLGKSYMHEAMKNADRIHSIYFGRLYLRAFGHQIKWAELKEAFEHWNIDKASAFSAIDASQFDPKLVEAVVKILRRFNSSQTK